MARIDYTDDQIINAIRSGGAQREEMLRFLYLSAAYKEGAKGMVRRLGGTEEDAKDVFQDSVIILDKMIRREEFVITASLRNYFLGITKKNWLRERGKRAKLNSLDSIERELVEESPEVKYLLDERRGFINENLEKLGSPCREMMRMAALAYSYLEISKELEGIKDDKEVKWKLKKCRERYRSLLERQPTLMKLLNLKLNHGK